MDIFLVVFGASFLLIFGVVIWKLNSGQLVGSLKGPWLAQVGRGTGNARVLVHRQGAEKAGWATVQVQVRAIGMMQGSSLTPLQAGELAGMLEEAARKVDSR